jgi:hypothetical protein
MKKKHHFRSEYEKMLLTLSQESKISITKKEIQSLSDYTLLFVMNIHLKKLNAIEFTEEELEMELH